MRQSMRLQLKEANPFREEFYLFKENTIVGVSEDTFFWKYVFPGCFGFRGSLYDFIDFLKDNDEYIF